MKDDKIPIKKELQKLLGQITEQYGAERRENMRLIDKYDDLLNGIKIWEEHKVGHMEWSDMDEMLLRWVESNRLGEPRS